jgi:arylsulfatase A-like enzyme
MATRQREHLAAPALTAGACVGAAWWTVETGFNHAGGAVVPAAVELWLLAAALGLGTLGGVVLAVVGTVRRRVAPGADSAATVLLGPGVIGLAALFTFLRVYEPPGWRGEGLFAVVAAAVAVLGARVWPVTEEGGAFLAVAARRAVAMAAAVVLGSFVLEDLLAVSLRGWRLPVVLGLLPLAGVALDRSVMAVAAVAGQRRAAVGLAGWALGLGTAAVLLGTPVHIEPIDLQLPPPAVARGARPDVILVSLDTTRADHLSLYGYHRPTTPRLDAFAADAQVYRRAYAPSPWTLPSHASLYTGLYPSQHGAHLAGRWLDASDPGGRRRVAWPLASTHTTLAEILRDAGYATGAVVANFSYLFRDFGVAQGFQHYDDAPGCLFRRRPHTVLFAQKLQPRFLLKPYRPGTEITTAALAWLAAHRDRPAFLLANYMEPHQPWLAPPAHDHWTATLGPVPQELLTRDLYTHEIRSFEPLERDFIVAQYDGQLAAMDAAVGDLLAGIRRLGLYDDALIVVFSDHGELLGEHDQVGHISRVPYEELLRVPLLVKYPHGTNARWVEDPVQLVDVFPTVLAALGLPVPEPTAGEVLPHVRHDIVAEDHVNPWLVSRYGAVYDRGLRAIYRGDLKLIESTTGDRYLFDLASDPGEAVNLAAERPAIASDLAQALGRWTATMTAAAPPRADDTDGEAFGRLRALGYVN